MPFSSRFFHTKKYGRHKLRSRQNAFTVCPLRSCSEISLRHFVHAFFERLFMLQHCKACSFYTRWGSFNAHISRVSVSDTAFALRQPGYEIDIAGIWSAPAEKGDAVRWVEATRDSLQPFAHGVYMNQLGDTSDQLVRSAYGANYARLVEIKKKYDPKNVLRLNQNIKPDSPPKA